MWPVAGRAETCMLPAPTVLGLLWPYTASALCKRGHAVYWPAVAGSFATALSFSLFAWRRLRWRVCWTFVLSPTLCAMCTSTSTAGARAVVIVQPFRSPPVLAYCSLKLDWHGATLAVLPLCSPSSTALQPAALSYSG